MEKYLWTLSAAVVIGALRVNVHMATDEPPEKWMDDSFPAVITRNILTLYPITSVSECSDLNEFRYPAFYLTLAEWHGQMDG